MLPIEPASQAIRRHSIQAEERPLFMFYSGNIARAEFHERYCTDICEHHSVLKSFAGEGYPSPPHNLMSRVWDVGFSGIEEGRD